MQTFNVRQREKLYLCKYISVKRRRNCSLKKIRSSYTRRTYLFSRVENTSCSRLSTASSSISKPPPRSLSRLKLYKSRNKNRKNEKNGRKKKVCFTSRSKFMRSPVVSFLLLRTFPSFPISFFLFLLLSLSLSVSTKTAPQVSFFSNSRVSFP